MNRFTLITLAVLGVAMAAVSPAMAKGHDRDYDHHHGHSYGHDKHWSNSSYRSYTTYPTVIYRSYTVPVYYAVVPPPPPPVIYRQSGFGFWFY